MTKEVFEVISHHNSKDVAVKVGEITYTYLREQLIKNYPLFAENALTIPIDSRFENATVGSSAEKHLKQIAHSVYHDFNDSA